MSVVTLVCRALEISMVLRGRFSGIFCSARYILHKNASVTTHMTRTYIGTKFTTINAKCLCHGIMSGTEAVAFGRQQVPEM